MRQLRHLEIKNFILYKNMFSRFALTSSPHEPTNKKQVYSAHIYRFTSLGMKIGPPWIFFFFFCLNVKILSSPELLNSSL